MASACSVSLACHCNWDIKTKAREHRLSGTETKRQQSCGCKRASRRRKPGLGTLGLRSRHSNPADTLSPVSCLSRLTTPVAAAHWHWLVWHLAIHSFVSIWICAFPRFGPRPCQFINTSRGNLTELAFIVNWLVTTTYVWEDSKSPLEASKRIM